MFTHLVSDSVILGSFLAYLFLYLVICLRLSFLSLFCCFLLSFFCVVFDSGFGLLIPLTTFYLIYCFLLKKFTLKTLSIDSIKLDVFPTLVDALTLKVYSFPFYLYLTRSGYYLSYYLAFYAISFCLIYCLAFLL